MGRQGGRLVAPALTLARYVPRESAVHRLDARAKLVAALLVAVGAVAASALWMQAVWTAILLAGFGAARLPWRLVLAGIRGALWLVLFVAAANVGWALWLARLGAWGGGEAAVRAPGELGLLLLRLFNLLLLAALFTATTLPVDAAEAVERLLRPLRRLRIPVHELGFLLVLTLSFVPLFLREARSLSDAHRIKRGRARWTLADRARALVPLAVPLFLAVFRRADELAVALDARCFVPGAPRTAYVAGRLGWPEWAAVTLAAVLCAACFRS